MNFSRRDFLKTGAGLIATLGGAYTLAALPKMGCCWQRPALPQSSLEISPLTSMTPLAWARTQCRWR